MSFDRDILYALLPAIYRIRDAEQREPLKALLAALAEQVAVVEENLAQLYDDQFIETCADWAVPYIGDLIGYRGLHGVVPAISSPRAEVANTIGYRRRKGTVAMLEQLARDVTGWNAHVVEFFQLLATTQYMKHLRPHNLYAPNLRRWEPLERLNSANGAFNSIPHTLDVRRIASRRGRFNIPNIGIFLWRLSAYQVTNAPAFQVDGRRYLFSPLGNNTPLFSRAQALDENSPLAGPFDVPMPISRRVLDTYLEQYYGLEPKLPGRGQAPPRPSPTQIPMRGGATLAVALLLYKDGNPVLPDPRQPNQTIKDLVEVCDLSDITGTQWAHTPKDKIAIDPVLGRISFPSNSDAPKSVEVTFHYGFSADMGGGEYERSAAFSEQLQPPVEVPGTQTLLQDALDSLNGAGVIEITDNGRYEGPKNINAQKVIELRAGNWRRPIVVPADPTSTAEIAITGDANAEVALNGLLISGYTLHVSGNLSRLVLRHCTLVPGLALTTDGLARHAGTPSIIIEAPDVQVEIDSCILGPLQVVNDNTHVQITNSIIDAMSEELVAYSAPNDELLAGGPLYITNSTIIGKLHTAELELASNTILLARLAATDTWQKLGAAILSDRRQAGCVRFSYVPPGSRVPRCYHCQPATDIDAVRVRPQFTSSRYGDPAYCQLSLRCAVEIRQGADDESEMGAFHNLFAPQRETNLRVRLDEYLRFGLEAGIFYAS